MSQAQEETNALSKREKLEQLAQEWGYKICFKDKLEKDDFIFKIPWSDGTYTSVFVVFDTTLKKDYKTFELNYKLKSTDHKLI